MIDVEQQVSRLEQIYRQIAGAEPRRSDVPIAPIPPEANAEQVVEENLQRLQGALAGVGLGGATAASPAAALPVAAPRVSVVESDRELAIAIELPGVKRGDVACELFQGMLRVRATREAPLGIERARPIYSEIPPCRFERTLPLPPSVRSESFHARLENGVLFVKCQKESPGVSPGLKIEVA